MEDDAQELGHNVSKVHVDHVALAEELAALAYPLRLELLGMLRTPHLASELRLSPRRVGPGENPERPAAKPTIQAHLDRLVQGQFVRVEDVGAGGRKAFRYSVNAQKWYGLVEDLRRLGLIYAGRGLEGDETGTVTPEPVVSAPEGPRLVLVHGVYEGKAFPLRVGPDDNARWVIGRRRGCDVTLDYDGYVSSENSEVVHEEGRFIVRDLGSKNGTHVNWRPVRRGAAHVLRPGDIVGVGRSLLVFVEG